MLCRECRFIPLSTPKFLNEMVVVLINTFSRPGICKHSQIRFKHGH